MEIASEAKSLFVWSCVCIVKGIKNTNRCPEIVYINAKKLKFVIVFFFLQLVFCFVYITCEVDSLDLRLQNKTC